jgi:hypothetical protein
MYISHTLRETAHIPTVGKYYKKLKIMKNIKILFSIILLFIIGCNTDDDAEMVNIIYETPFSISPVNNSTFYSHERFIINWELPSGLNNSEIQVLVSSSPINTVDISAFEDVPINGGNQTSYNFAYIQDPDNPISEIIYIGYRIRARDYELETGYSEWTEIRTFKIIPLLSLTKQTINVSYNLNFITEEVNNEYYSGIVEKFDYSLAEITLENNLDLERIKVIRPANVEANFLTMTSDGRNPFHPVTFGFNDSEEQNTSVYPFEPLGQVFPGSYQESPIQAQLYNQQHVNLNNDMRKNNLKVAYLLVDNPNTEHQLQLNFNLDIYLD